MIRNQFVGARALPEEKAALAAISKQGSAQAVGYPEGDDPGRGQAAGALAAARKREVR